jgi:hypothetical protein
LSAPSVDGELNISSGMHVRYLLQTLLCVIFYGKDLCSYVHDLEHHRSCNMVCKIHISALLEPKFLRPWTNNETKENNVFPGAVTGTVEVTLLIDLKFGFTVPNEH